MVVESMPRVCTKCGGHLRTDHPTLDLLAVSAATIPTLPFAPVDCQARVDLDMARNKFPRRAAPIAGFGGPFLRRIAWICATAAMAANAYAQPPHAIEPDGLWPGPMQGRTPLGLKGATVLDTSAFISLAERDKPVLVDVANKVDRPAGHPAENWMPVHLSVAGAIWLPGAGTGKDPSGFKTAFARRIADATRGDKDKPIVTFCHRDHWGSWNAAKRLTMLGYTHVYWYPGGGEGWADGAPSKVERLDEDPAWKAAGFDRSSAGDMPDR